MLEQLETLIFSLADDELIIGHRHAEWIGLGPILEEDIAFASIAQDETGHAQAYYQILTDLGLRTPDEYAFRRTAKEFRCAQLVELPNFDYDYALALVRHFLYDGAEQVRLQALSRSSYEPLAGLAQRLLREKKSTAGCMLPLGLSGWGAVLRKHTYACRVPSIGFSRTLGDSSRSRYGRSRGDSSFGSDARTMARSRSAPLRSSRPSSPNA